MKRTGIALACAAFLLPAPALAFDMHTEHRKPHGGLSFPDGYDPYTESGCCNGGDCQPIDRYVIRNGVVSITVNGYTFDVPLSSSKMRVWSFPLSPEERASGTIDPKRQSVRDELSKKWHWCGWSAKEGLTGTHCILFNPGQS